MSNMFITNYGTNQCDIFEALFFFESTQSAVQLTKQILLYRLQFLVYIYIFIYIKKKWKLASAGSPALVFEFKLVCVSKISPKKLINKPSRLGFRATLISFFLLRRWKTKWTKRGTTDQRGVSWGGSRERGHDKCAGTSVSAESTALGRTPLR